MEIKEEVSKSSEITKEMDRLEDTMCEMIRYIYENKEGKELRQNLQLFLEFDGPNGHEKKHLDVDIHLIESLIMIKFSQLEKELSALHSK